MGSSYSGSYNGTNGSSQPFAESYEVCKPMYKKDITDPDIYNPNTGYYKNPTAMKIEDAISADKIKIGDKVPNGPITYVMDTNGNIIIGKRSNPNNPNARSPHPMLIGGKHPEVQCAGMITFKNGKIVSVDNQSGHFKPHINSLDKVDTALSDLAKRHPEIFDRKSKWR